MLVLASTAGAVWVASMMDASPWRLLPVLSAPLCMRAGVLWVARQGQPPDVQRRRRIAQDVPPNWP